MHIFKALRTFVMFHCAVSFRKIYNDVYTKSTKVVNTAREFVSHRQITKLNIITLLAFK